MPPSRAPPRLPAASPSNGSSPLSLAAGAGLSLALLWRARQRRGLAVGAGGSRARAQASASSHEASTSAKSVSVPTTPCTLKPSDYPPVRRDEAAGDDYHGTRVADPYRWLEDPDADETVAFVRAQNALTERVLAACGGVQGAVAAEMTRLTNYEKVGVPYLHGTSARAAGSSADRKKHHRYHFMRNSGLQPQSVMYTSPDPAGQDARSVLLDPNELSSDGTVALSSYAFSEDGAMMAYSLASGGSDWVTVKVLRVQPDGSEPEHLPDELRNVKFTSLAWTHDGRGFFYNRYAPPSSREGGELGTETDSNVNQQLYYHVMGTPQSQDILCFEAPSNPTWMVGASVSTDGRFVILTVADGCDPVNRLYCVDLGACDHRVQDDFMGRVVRVVDNFDAAWEYVGSQADGSVTLRTNLDAPKYKLVRADLAECCAQGGQQGRPLDSVERSWDVLVPEAEDVLEWADALAGDRLVVCYLRDVVNVVEVRAHGSGALLGTVPLPVGSVYSFSGSHTSSTFYIKLTSFLEPGVTFECDAAAYGEEAEDATAVGAPQESGPAQPDNTQRCSVLRRTELAGFDLDAFTTEQVFVTSKDGTRVPMFLVYPKGLQRDGTNPTLLYGYGGFNISLTPDFSVKRLVWCARLGGVLAVANLRGGGEYGEEWHRAGTYERKQNVFDDFAACAQHLIDSGITSPERLAVEGGSNGGLLVGATCNQRPDLVAAGIAAVGVMVRRARRRRPCRCSPPARALLR